MRIAMVNMLHTGSTGRIMFGIAERARCVGHKVRTYSPHAYQPMGKMERPSMENHCYFGYLSENRLHILLAKATGFHGCFSWFGTKQLLRDLDDFQPDVIHLHNLHNWTIDVKSLFDYIKKKNIKVVWTLHDCWPVTGRCGHFSLAGCERWKTGCHHCPSLASYPSAYVDQSRILWKFKKKWFTGVEKMMLVSPSQWLADIVKQSYLAEYPLQVINNGIDLQIFQSKKKDVLSIKSRYNINASNYLILGVAFDWGIRKGLDVFIHLAEQLDEQYRIILVGTDDSLDKLLPKSIVSIHRMQNTRELAKLYGAADVFVNPTREDNYPTTNMEALACGTPVITFRTGGSPESLDETCGAVVECNDIEALKKEIVRVCTNQPYTREDCRARAEDFDKHKRFEEYLRLYEMQF